MPYFFLRLEGLVVFLATLILYFSQGGTHLGLLLLLVPDVTFIGYFKNRQFGAFLYNLGHSHVLPFLLLVLSFLYHETWGYLFALLWMAHIGLDRALGIGLKFPQSFLQTHLGKLSERTRIASFFSRFK
jgi:hypothetical protein